MTAMLLLLVVVCTVLPARYIVPSLPALWIFQNTILGEYGILFTAGTAHLSLVDFVLVALLLKLVVTAVPTRQFPVDKPLYAAVADFITGMTDRYALRVYEEYFLPRRWEVY